MTSLAKEGNPLAPVLRVSARQICEEGNELHPTRSHRAWRGIPAGSVGLLLEVCRRNHGLSQICRILECGRDDEISISVGSFHEVVILRQPRIRAVGNTIPAQITGPKVCCRDFQRTGLRRAAVAGDRETKTSSREFPFRFRYAL